VEKAHRDFLGLGPGETGMGRRGVIPLLLLTCLAPGGAAGGSVCLLVVLFVLVLVLLVLVLLLVLLLCPLVRCEKKKRGRWAGTRFQNESCSGIL